MTIRKPLMILGLTAVVAAMAITGTSFAQTPTPPAGNEAKDKYQEMFLDRLAAALGTTRDQLTSAFLKARNETVDQAVKDGKLTQERADKIKAQQDKAPFGFRFGFDRSERGANNKMVFNGNKQLQAAIAKALGLTSDELIAQLRSGKSLAELAQGKEQAIKDAIVGVVKTQLDEAVKNGRITQEQADKRLEQIRNLDLSKFGGLKIGPMRGDGEQKRPQFSKPLGKATPGTKAQ